MSNFIYSNIIFDNNPDIASFYKNFNTKDFKNINASKLLELKKKSKGLNEYYTKDNFYNKKSKYIRLMNKFKTNPKGYGITNDLEKYILFMYSVDPKFKATYMYASVNKIQEVRMDMVKEFGVFDPNLVQIEKYYILNILGPKKKKEILDKVEELSFR